MYGNLGWGAYLANGAEISTKTETNINMRIKEHISKVPFVANIIAKMRS